MKWYIVLVMEGMVAAMIGLVGALLSALLIWIRSDIKSLADTLGEHGKRLTRIEVEHGQRLARIETMLGVPHSPHGHSAAEPPASV